MRCEVFQRDFMSIARFAFQACLIDRSSISPSLESTTYGQRRIDYRTRRHVLTPLVDLVCIQAFEKVR
jgi:hypothetical protein